MRQRLINCVSIRLTFFCLCSKVHVYDTKTNWLCSLETNFLFFCVPVHKTETNYLCFHQTNFLLFVFQDTWSIVRQRRFQQNARMVRWFTWGRRSMDVWNSDAAWTGRLCFHILIVLHIDYIAIRRLRSFPIALVVRINRTKYHLTPDFFEKLYFHVITSDWLASKITTAHEHKLIT